MKRMLTGWLTAIALVLFSTVAAAQEPLKLGRDYTLIDPPAPSENPAKIEVNMYFSFACPHCFELNQRLVAWTKKLPADVDFKHVPVSFNPFYQLMARFYYTLEALGELPRLESAVFDALHVKGLRLVSEKSIGEWMATQGVEAKKFQETFNSFGVATKVRRADQLAQAVRLSGVPTLVVDGRYQVLGKDYAETLALTDKIIDMRRAERANDKLTPPTLMKDKSPAAPAKAAKKPASTEQQAQK